MTLKEKIFQDFKKAFTEKSQIKKSVLSMLQSEIKNKEIELGLKSQKKDLPDKEVIQLLKKSQKQRQDSIENYLRGNRQELADKEKEELAVVEEYLPKQLDEKDLESKVDEIISEENFSGKQDFGKAMGLVMSKLKGQADGESIRFFVEKKLNK